MAYTNSPLVNYTLLSPNNSGQRTHSIDRITPHMVVGQCTVEALGQVFLPVSRQASSNYGIGYDGRVGMYVEEKNRSWCSSSGANDQRAITIEIASDTYYPYRINDAAYATAIKLMADICKRNGKTKLVWLQDKTKSLNYSDNGQKSNEMLITLHKWFGSTNCPGAYIEEHLTDMVKKVNDILGGDTPSTYTVREAAQKCIDDGINGQARKQFCEENGLEYTDVQAEIDLMLGKDIAGNIAELAKYLPAIGTGSYDDLTKYLQTMLQKMGYYTGSIDGYCGSYTVAAIKALQSNWNTVYGDVEIDGWFGLSCWTRLLTGK